MSSAKTLARRCAAQALYLWQMSGETLAAIEQRFVEELALTRELYRRAQGGAALSVAEQDQLEELLEKFGIAEASAEALPETATPSDWLNHYLPPNPDLRTFADLLHQVPARLDEIDAAINEVADRPVSEIDPIERAILRLGAYELMFQLATPYRVALNEGINLAKYFGATESHRYVNGILDKIARKYRVAER